MLEPGQLFAHRYRVIRHIAEGGMGAIFEAEHTATERRVALKLLFTHIMSVVSARKKFELEAKISARVNSPNIVEVLDAGFDEASKSPFLVMELLDGQTLSDHVHERGALNIDQALPLLQQVAAGLDAAHGYKETNGTLKPIVHRDLKPENLFLAREHGNFVVKILDYGIAKVLGETGNVSQEVRGTPLYMAFEQVTASALSPQTDVWALGLIAYYMLTASHYWRSANEPSANMQSLFAEILTLPLEAPSVRLMQHKVNVKLPAAFDAWLLECIQRDPTRRFASAGAAIAALARAYGRVLDKRARVLSTRPLGLAATEAFASAAVAPAPAAPAAPAVAQPTVPAHLGTAASLPGIATEHVSVMAPARESRTPERRWLMPAAAASALLLGGLGWWMSGNAGPTHAAPGAVSAAGPSAAAPAVLPAPAAEPAPVAAPAPVPRPVVSVTPVAAEAASKDAHPGSAPVAKAAETSAPANAGTDAAVSGAAAIVASDGTRAAAAQARPTAIAGTPAAKTPAAPPGVATLPRPRKVSVPAPAPATRKPAEQTAKKAKASDAYRMR